MPVTAPEQAAIIDRVVELLRDNYVFPEKANVIERELRKNIREGIYSSTLLLNAFLEHLNADLQRASGDKHLKINNNSRIVERIRREAEGKKEIPKGFLELLHRENFRLRKVEMLEGNIGYFKFDNFVELQFVREALRGAMDFLHESDAIILDLTDNGGGASETSDYLVSYFLRDSTTVGEWWVRKTGETTLSVTKHLPEVRQMLEVPLYILVGGQTASAAEGVAYTLQQFKRAVVIGEQSKGLGNPGELFPIDDRLFTMIPTILNKNSVTGTNWDGMGVTPDIKVEPAKALTRARVEALRRLAAMNSDGKEKFRYEFLAQGYESLLSIQKVPPGFGQACTGNYEGGRMVVSKDGALYFILGNIERKLSYMDDLTFLVEGRTDYHLRFPLHNGEVNHFEVLWFDDTMDKYRKLK
ncbi:MAG: S41 family peptidase [Ignavibacteriales bacterium]|nr:S41 family peptidase [Ignavibacteriales bacterium]